MRRSMPTAARMIAALCLGFGAMAMVPVLFHYYPDEPWNDDRTGMFRLFGAMGLLVGWYSLGKKVETEEGTGIFLGLRAAIEVAFWTILIMAINGLWGEIIADRLVGAEPAEAFFDLTTRIGNYLVFGMHPRVLLIWAGIGITVGLLTKAVSKVWN